MTTGKVFQLSDLANNRTEFVAEARSGLARLRDKDGTSLVMMPEAQLTYLQRLNDLSSIHQRLNRLVATGRPVSMVDLGDQAWLRVFDDDELREFADELGEALAAARGDGDTALADDVLDAWRLTSKQLSDPLRNSVLTGSVSGADLVEALRPEDEDSQ